MILVHKGQFAILRLPTLTTECTLSFCLSVIATLLFMSVYVSPLYSDTREERELRLAGGTDSCWNQLSIPTKIIEGSLPLQHTVMEEGAWLCFWE